ncbi:hypothetical protein KCP75_10685 [Salmonella enterica subsp. enterica]|nr:hypothetical protein KCP75_10685 [Salmonella enterica subsp. enterica]
MPDIVWNGALPPIRCAITRRGVSMKRVRRGAGEAREGDLSDCYRYPDEKNLLDNVTESKADCGVYRKPDQPRTPVGDGGRPVMCFSSRHHQAGTGKEPNRAPGAASSSPMLLLNWRKTGRI